MSATNTDHLVAVEDLVTGDLVDLQGDEIADPLEDGHYEYSYARVEAVRTDHVYGVAIVVVDFSHDGGEVTVNFPKGHQVLKGK